MKKFLNEKDDQKWDYFVDKLGKKDHKTLKKLLCAEEASSEGKTKRPKGRNQMNPSLRMRAKIHRRRRKRIQNPRKMTKSNQKLKKKKTQKLK